MANRAVGQLIFLDVVFLYKALANLKLVGRGFPRHAEHLVRGTQVFLGGLVAFQAPLHVQRGRLVRQGHLVNFTVAGGAAHALGDVDAVIKVDEVGQIVDARPLERLAGLPAVLQRLEHRGVREDLRVAGHARFRGRNACEIALLDRRVAIPAINAIVTNVARMAERDRLVAANPHHRDGGRVVEEPKDGTQYKKSRRTEDQTRPGDRVGTWTEDLCHGTFPLSVTRATEIAPQLSPYLPFVKRLLQPAPLGISGVGYSLKSSSQTHQIPIRIRQTCEF